MRRRDFVVSTLAIAGAGFSVRAQSAATDDLPILSRTGKQLLLARAEVAELRAGLHGSLLLNGDAGYEQARRRCWITRYAASRNRAPRMAR